MREFDPDESAIATRHNELRDIHHRIDALKEENERQFNSLTKDLHALEVAVAKGGRFPAAAWVAALGIGVTVVGTGAALYGQLLVTQRISQDAKDAIEAHVVVAFPEQTRVWQMDERIKGLESRIISFGTNVWHRTDQDSYARIMDERDERTKIRLNALEKKQERACDGSREDRQ